MAQNAQNLTTPAKSVPALTLLADSNKAIIHIVRGVCAASTGAEGLASNDGMGLNKGLPWWCIVYPKNDMNNQVQKIHSNQPSKRTTTGFEEEKEENLKTSF